jgi:hypothetical protein
MSHPIRFGRWTAELHQRAVHVTREPDPNCSGSGGGWISHRMGADWDECACLDQLRTWRLPVWPRSQRTETEPF